MKIEASLVLGDFISSETVSVSHRPHRWYHIMIVGDLITWNEFPSIVVNMTIYLLDCSLGEFIRDRLAHGLVIVHDVANHLSMEINSMAHLVLQVKILVMCSIMINVRLNGLTVGC